MVHDLTIYTDGGARGNPGPSACAFVIPQINQSGSKFLGTATNNEAEYQGVMLALGHLGHLGNLGHLKFFSDSLLVVNQLRGLWKIREPRLKDLYSEIVNLENLLKEKNPNLVVSYTHIPREKNLSADRLVNQTLDESLRGNSFPLQ